MSVYNLAHELARELARCEERKAYDAARTAVEKDQTAVSMLKDFRRRQLEMEMLAMQGKKPSEEELQRFTKLAEAISLHKPISDFLAAEARLMRVVADVQKIMSDALGLWDYMSSTSEETAK